MAKGSYEHLVSSKSHLIFHNDFDGQKRKKEELLWGNSGARGKIRIIEFEIHIYNINKPTTPFTMSRNV